MHHLLKAFENSKTNRSHKAKKTMETEVTLPHLNKNLNSPVSTKSEGIKLYEGKRLVEFSIFHLKPD